MEKGSGGKKPAKSKRLTKRCKTNNSDKPIVDKDTSGDDSDNRLSDGKTALKKVKEAQEKRGKVRKGPQSITLQHFNTPKATVSGAEKRWSFRCKYCPRYAIMLSLKLEEVYESNI
jgi:hypothetical protein